MISVLLAAVDWPSVALIGTVVVTALTSALTYKRGTRTDEQLNISTLTQANFQAQRELVDQLQEENERLRVRLREADETEARLRGEVRNHRHEAGDARAGLAAAEVLIAEKDRMLAERDAHIADIERNHGA